MIRSPGGGDNLFLSSIVALDADTGEMNWYYQTTPGDNWDYTAVQDMALRTVGSYTCPMPLDDFNYNFSDLCTYANIDFHNVRDFQDFMDFP